MKLIIKKTKKLAFERFLNHIKFQNQYPFQLDGFGIPKKIINDAEKLKNVEIKKLNPEQKKIYKDIKKLFNNLWRKYQKNLDLIPKRLKNYSKTLSSILKFVEESTKIKWAYKKIFIIPSIRNWGSEKNNLISIGIRPNFLIPKKGKLVSNAIINLIIHELVHVNIKGAKIKNKLQYESDSEEIAVTLITRKVARLLNQNFSRNILDQKLSKSFQRLEKYESDFEKFLKQSNSYSILVKKIDIFLKLINHKEIRTS